ncbi:putative bifunctional diguanylate cyclase/phosphodiesterase [Yoonia sp. R2331]|uniref:putative bifunctional diguanylate cyclase/phosphodiesterase n=1 Tax=Yoonia sp. R2331 TaxID=3237238 RepID=UPI0034E5FBD9
MARHASPSLSLWLIPPATALIFGVVLWADPARFVVPGLQNLSPHAVNSVFGVMMVVLILFPAITLQRTRAMQAKLDALSHLRSHQAARDDPLTGLGNHMALQDALDSPQPVGAGLSFILIDLDHFKAVNAMRGRDVGDQVLIAVAKRLRSAVPAGALLTRIEEDRFAILAPTNSPDFDAASIASQCLAALSDPFSIGPFTIAVSASCGVAQCAAGMMVADILTEAGQALSAAKADGRAQFRFFDAALGLTLEEEASLQSDLIASIDSGGLYCVYQPYFDLPNQRLAGAEMLARWHHPTLGHVPPDRFIRLADKLGLIDKLSDQLLRQACRVAVDWPDDLVLSFNVTPSQFADPHLVPRILRVLDQFGRPPALFEVEVTERALLSDEPRARVLMQELMDAGIRIALDDFGADRSSLSLLTTYPFDRIKIDRHLIRDVDDSPVNRAVIKGLVDIAHTLGMAVTAVGVEHPPELSFLQDFASIRAQGYLLSRPLSATALLAQINSGGPGLSVVPLRA